MCSFSSMLQKHRKITEKSTCILLGNLCFFLDFFRKKKEYQACHRFFVFFFFIHVCLIEHYTIFDVIS